MEQICQKERKELESDRKILVFTMRYLGKYTLLLLLCIFSLNTLEASSQSSSISCQPTLDYQFNLLRNPAYVSYNTYLDQNNFLELASAGSKAVSAQVSIYDTFGTQITNFIVNIPAFSQKDIDINRVLSESCAQSAQCPSFTDYTEKTVPGFGLIKIEYNDDDSEAPLVGRLSSYARDINSDALDIAYTRQLSNGLTSSNSFGIANAIDPTSNKTLVYNWAEITSIDSDQNFLLELFDSNGIQLVAREIFVPANGQKHVYLNEFLSAFNLPIALVKLNNLSGGKHIFSLTRYARSYEGLPRLRYAFNALGERFQENTQFFLAHNRREESNTSQHSYLEIANISTSLATADIAIFNEIGEEIKSIRIEIGPLSQKHLSINSILEEFKTDLARIVLNSSSRALVAHHVSYFFDTETNELRTAYLSNNISTAGFLKTSSSNTFLDMENEILISSVSDSDSQIEVNTRGFTGLENGSFSSLNNDFSVQLSSSQLNLLDIKEISSVNKSSYGLLSLENPLTALDTFFAETQRIKRNKEGNLSFIVPIQVKAHGMLLEPYCPDVESVSNDPIPPPISIVP